MKKDLLKQQIKPLLLFGLPAWGLALVFVFIIKQPLLVAVIFVAYLIPFGVNRGRFRDLYNQKYHPKLGLKLLPHYIEGEDDLNKYYAINLRWLIIFFGTVLILFVTTGPFFHG